MNFLLEMSLMGHQQEYVLHAHRGCRAATRIVEGEQSAKDGVEDGGPHDGVLHLAMHIAIIERVTGIQK